MATAALVCGIAGLVLFFLLVLSVVALVLGLIAWNRAREAPAPGDGRARALAGWILGALGVAAFLGVIVGGALAGWYDQTSVHNLEVGQCIQFDTSATEQSYVDDVECDLPHDGEVYAVRELLEAGGDLYPGAAAIEDDAAEICEGRAFENFIGASFERSELAYYVMMPTRTSWDGGDRRVLCLAITADGSELTESVEGSGR